MDFLIKLLFWAHLVALAMGLGGGIAMSQVGPRLAAAAPDARGAWLPLAEAYTRIAMAGMVLLLITGPLLLWLKFNGGAGLGPWFMAKMALVAASIVTIGLSHWGMARFKRGDEGGGRLMSVTGPLTSVIVLAIILTAVFTFD